MSKKHGMVDLETMGTDADSVFFSCGACYFDPMTGEITDKFYEIVDMKDQIDNYGRKMSVDTVKWWMGQADDARKVVQQDGISFEEFLVKFAAWYKPNTEIWSNGACFDLTILNNAYGPYTPWKFWHIRDVRTIMDLASHKVSRDSVPFEGTAHNALDDAIHQAKYVSKMYKALKS